MSAPSSNYRAWLKKAENDLLNIENNLVARDAPWDTVCFHAQQAAEKALKAFLVFHGGNTMRTHDLVALLSECVTLSPELRQLESACQTLTYYGVGTRYPDDLYEPTKDDALRLVELARSIRSEVLRRLPQ